jgi:hypothetical protein
MSTQLEQVAAKAKKPLHFVGTSAYTSSSIETWRQMNRRGASGVDGETLIGIQKDSKFAKKLRVCQFCIWQTLEIWQTLDLRGNTWTGTGAR